MTKRLLEDGQFIKFEIPKDLKLRFIAACDKMDKSQSYILRDLVNEFVDEVEGGDY